MNVHEKKAVGNYIVDSYSLANESTGKINLPLLYIYDDKTFEIKYDATEIIGKWKADDYREFILIDFNSHGKIETGEMYGNDKILIDIGAPSPYYFPKFKKITFKQI